jgi:hypothetical protein
MRSVRRRCNICSTTWRMWSGWLFRLRCGNSPELRRKDYLVTNWLERFAHERLAHVRPVRLSRVEERHPEFVRTSNDVDVVVGVDGVSTVGAEASAAEPDRRKPPGHLFRVAFFMSVLSPRRAGPLALFTAGGCDGVDGRTRCCGLSRTHPPPAGDGFGDTARAPTDSLVVVSFRDKGRARPRADGSSAGLRLSSAQFVSVPRWCAARSVCRVPIGIAERQRRVGPVPIARRSGSPCLAVCSGSLPG